MAGDGFPVLIASQEVVDKRGKVKIVHTEKSTKTGFNAWCSIQLKTELNDIGKLAKECDESWLIEQLKAKVMPDATEFQPLSSQSLRNLNISLGEFVEHYRKANGERVSPATLLTYMESINRWLKTTWKLKVDTMHDAIFNDEKVGYIHVANRIAAKQQANGERSRPYNTLTDQDVYDILNHDVTNLNDPQGYVNRTIVIVGLLLGLRPEALRQLSWNLFTRIKVVSQEQKSYPHPSSYLMKTYATISILIGTFLRIEKSASIPGTRRTFSSHLTRT